LEVAVFLIWLILAFLAGAVCALAVGLVVLGRLTDDADPDTEDELLAERAAWETW
jgi:hypothetical protein